MNIEATENQYTDAAINAYMDANIHFDVFTVAVNLGTSTYRIGECQHNRMRLALAKNRNSPLWSEKGYTSPDKRRMTNHTFYSMLARIKNKESGAFQYACDNFRMSPEYRNRLKAASAESE